jgi:hypothetical protein
VKLAAKGQEYAWTGGEPADRTAINDKIARLQLNTPLAFNRVHPMGYHVTLSRPEPSLGITAQEWRNFVAGRPELKIVYEDEHFITTTLDGDDNLALHYSTGSASVFTKNPSGPRIIEYMASIAPHFGGVVTGDEGETFATEADWGTQSDWDTRKKAQRPRSRWELSRGKRVMVGLLLGVLIFIIKEVFFSR